MKLDNEEKLIKNIQKFISKVHDEFENIEDVSVVLLGLTDEFGEKQYQFNKKNMVFPLKVTILHNGTTSIYKFLSKNECDDEYPLQTKNGDNVGFNQFRKYILENLPECLKKSSYENMRVFHTDNIEQLVRPIDKKIEAMVLSNELIINESKPKRLKI